jgi:hypothetical protein
MESTLDLQLLIYPDDHRTFGPCACCGKMTSRVWGYVNQGERTVAAYFVEWTPGHSEQAANFDLIIGDWGPDAEPIDRKGVAVAFRQLQSGPAFMVIDAMDRPIGSNRLVGQALERGQVVGHQIAETVFLVCDSIFLHDHRISDLHPPDLSVGS